MIADVERIKLNEMQQCLEVPKTIWQVLTAVEESLE